MTWALTFDDGPDPVWTPAVLDALAHAGARATFFVLGEAAARHPDVVRRTLAEGHAVELHGHAHLRHPALTEVGEPLEEGTRDRKLEHGVPEELEPFVRGSAVGGPRRMREDRRRPFGREPVDQLPQGVQAGLTGGT